MLTMALLKCRRVTRDLIEAMHEIELERGDEQVHLIMTKENASKAKQHVELHCIPASSTWLMGWYSFHHSNNLPEFRLKWTDLRFYHFLVDYENYNAFMELLHSFPSRQRVKPILMCVFTVP